MKPKIRKHLISTALIVAMLFSTISTSVSASGFSDVSSSHSYLDSINYVSDNGIMNGTGSGNFSPNSSLTRAMDFEVAYSAPNDKASLVTTAATGSNYVVVKGTDHGMTLEGTDSAYTVTVEALDGDKVDSFELPASKIG